MLVRPIGGSRDPMVPEQLGQAAYRRLSEMGYSVEYQSYPMEHAVCPEEIAAISQWLQRVLANAP